ncbi:MAG: hypothetical protein Q9168_005282 [Polycauliona sp. 1 TL-2023]
MESLLVDDFYNTPDFSSSALYAQSAPQRADAFITWRLEYLQSQMNSLAVTEAAMNKSEKDALSMLEAEFLILVEQRRFILEGLSDAPKAPREAYPEEMKYAFTNTSGHGTTREDFKEKVAHYLDSRKPDTMYKSYYCNLLGEHIYTASPGIKCAHIVPFPFDNCRFFAYIFGTEDAMLRSPRNGLMLFEPIEEAFDKGEIAILPHGSIDQRPTEWKVVVLQIALLDKVCYTNPATGETTTWRAIHNKSLSWRNDNRPARRYLYFRYILAWLAARREGYPDWQAKMPSGTAWTSPDKPSGYLRSSILRVLASKVGDATTLPEDMIIEGGFDDPDSESKVRNQAGSIRIPLLVRDHLNGRMRIAEQEDEKGEKRERGDDADDDDEGEDEDEDEDDDDDTIHEA